MLEGVYGPLSRADGDVRALAPSQPHLPDRTGSLDVVPALKPNAHGNSSLQPRRSPMGGRLGQIPAQYQGGADQSHPEGADDSTAHVHTGVDDRNAG